MNLDFMEKQPRCFGEFKLLKFQESNLGNEFISRNVVCTCGNKKLNIYASLENELYLAPVILECPACGHKEQIFNPDIHGWDGENGDNCSMKSTEEPKVLPNSPKKVMVEYSYQGLENYEGLAKEGITNLEDYFDTFNLCGVDENGATHESIDYECA